MFYQLCFSCTSKHTIVRIKSILNKYDALEKEKQDTGIREPEGEAEKELMMSLAGFISMMQTAWEEMAPHKVCAYIYDLANAFNHFYHETKILQEEDEEKQAGYIALLKLTKEILETCAVFYCGKGNHRSNPFCLFL